MPNVPEPKGRIIEDVIVEAGNPWGKTVKAGQHVMIVDLEGL